MNVIAGERYKQVSDEILQYALGYWGREESESIAPTVRDKILDRPRAKLLAQQKSEQPTLQALRAQYGGADVSDDDLLLNYFAGAEVVAQMRAQRQKHMASQGIHGLQALIQKLGQAQNVNYIHIRRGNHSVAMQA